ncbi:centrosomal protein of 72 kDa isoform X2 [Choloepus didactylus]|uniref:centrosomal protein of 72 kDa isoform X2 n=1 Tax=Choloepus didactylus TaxID=27675 RepID=UPI00189D26C9|nr:centrosomal protein of 72 kDa isoform X2 [Choloepus didactylus]
MAPAGPRLVLSEERVRARSGLAAHRDLAELQSLSIPGTYQEKITHLGNSLMNLTGLKSLDLSRNSLVSLEGIQYLIMLESLNLYYNCISSLAEVFRLYSLTELTDVDFRLNPVVKNESDYRLFVVHMLPKLRQLDDRPVRESERKASQLHFAPQKSLDSKHGSPAALKVGRPHRSRRMCPDSVSQKCPVLDADDEAVLNLIAECEWGLSNPPGSASSSQKEQESEFHSSRDSPGAEDLASSQKSSLLVPRAAEKHQKRRMPSSWFQEPRGQACPSCLGRPDGPLSPKDRLSRRDSTGSRSEAAAEEARAHGVSSTRELHAEAPSGPRAALEDAFLEALLSLVSRHGDGCRSLLGDEAFLAQARHLLSSVQAFTAARDSSVVNEEISYMTLENKSLQSHLVEQQQQQQAKVSELMAQLSMSRRELDDSRKRLERSLEENSSLKSLLFSMKKDVGNAGASATLSLQLSGLQASVEKLSGETAELKQHLEHHDRIQELIQMLQESHSSLVSTNEHLLEELGQVRAQHKAEVEQLHWSYKELKKTLALFPPGSPDPGAHARPGPLPH